MNDENYSYRAQFEGWLNSINGARSNIRAGTGDSIAYTTDVVVNQLSKRGGDPGTEFVRSYILESAFPTDISPITLDWGDNDTIEEFTVTFSFDLFLAVNGPGAVNNADSVPSPVVA